MTHRKIHAMQESADGFLRASMMGNAEPSALKRVPAAWGGLRIVVISDTHNRHQELPPLGSGDILIHCGDWTNFGNPEREMFPFLQWFATQDFALRILIAGNHELTLCGSQRAHVEAIYGKQSDFLHPFERARGILAQFEDDVVVLHDESIIFEVPGGGNMHIYGTSQISGGEPVVNERWGFHKATDEWDHVPHDVDILITHSPPKNIRDSYNGHCLGSTGLLARVAETRPVLHVFGHIHSGYGVHSPVYEPEDGLPPTLFVNASSSAEDDFQSLNKPIVFESYQNE